MIKAKDNIPEQIYSRYIDEEHNIELGEHINNVFLFAIYLGLAYFVVRIARMMWRQFIFNRKIRKLQKSYEEKIANNSGSEDLMKIFVDHMEALAKINDEYYKVKR